MPESEVCRVSELGAMARSREREGCRRAARHGHALSNATAEIRSMLSPERARRVDRRQTRRRFVGGKRRSIACTPDRGPKRLPLRLIQRNWCPPGCGMLGGGEGRRGRESYGCQDAPIPSRCARERVCAGLNMLASAVKVTLGPKGRLVMLRTLLRRADGDQLRRRSSRGRSSSPTRSRIWARNWRARSPRRPRRPPATERRPPPCSRRRSSTRG